MGCEYRVKGNGKGCKFYEYGKRGRSGYCTNPKAQYYRCIDWIASVKWEKIILSHSQMTAWERCPWRWCLENIEGIEVRPEHDSLPLRMGNELQYKLSGVGEPSVWGINDDEYKQTVDIFYDFIIENDMLPTQDEADWETTIIRDGFRGNLDCIQEELSQFIEIKFGGRPDFYMTNHVALTQLEDYYFLRPDLKRAVMCPVRRPELKQKKKKDETVASKLNRIREDLEKRTNHYFPMYDPLKDPPKWGKVFGKHEFHLDELKLKMDWTRMEIQTACACNYFVQKRSNCSDPFECDYLSICNTGGINWGRYRKKVFHGGDKTSKAGAGEE